MVPWNLSAWISNCTRSSSQTPQIQQSICTTPYSLLTCFLRKCLLKEPEVAYEATLSRNVRDRFPRQTKHFVGLFSLLIDRIAWLRASGSLALRTGGLSSFTGRPHWIRWEAGPSSMPQYAVMALILRRFSFSRDVSGSVKMASIKRKCSGVTWSDRSNASRVSLSTTFPGNCRSLSITGCSFLKRSTRSTRRSLRCRCFSLWRWRQAFWYFSSPSESPRTPDSFTMRRFNLTMHGRLLTDADCSVVNFRGRRGSIEWLIEHANLIRSL